MQTRPSAGAPPSSQQGALLGLPLGLPQLVLAVVIGVFVAAVMVAVSAARDDVYESRATLLIDQPSAIASAPLEGVIQKLDRLRFKYAPLLSTSVMRRPVLESTGLRRDQVVELQATPRPNSLLIDVFAQAKTPQASRALAEAGAQQIAAYAATEQADIGIEEASRFLFEHVDEARPGARVSAGVERSLTIAVLAGFFAAVGVVLVLYALRIGRTT